MVDLTEIMEAINKLSEKEYSQLRRWFWEKDQQKWDKQIEMDSASERINFLIKEALDEEYERMIREKS